MNPGNICLGFFTGGCAIGGCIGIAKGIYQYKINYDTELYYNRFNPRWIRVVMPITYIGDTIKFAGEGVLFGAVFVLLLPISIYSIHQRGLKRYKDSIMLYMLNFSFSLFTTL